MTTFIVENGRLLSREETEYRTRKVSRLTRFKNRVTLKLMPGMWRKNIANILYEVNEIKEVHRYYDEVFKDQDLENIQSYIDDLQSDISTLEERIDELEADRKGVVKE